MGGASIGAGGGSYPPLFYTVGVNLEEVFNTS